MEEILVKIAVGLLWVVYVSALALLVSVAGWFFVVDYDSREEGGQAR